MVNYKINERQGQKGRVKSLEKVREERNEKKNKGRKREMEMEIKERVRLKWRRSMVRE